MIKVYLLAYLNRNFGDDLFLKILLERYPNIIFYSMSNYEYSQYQNLRLTEYKKVRIVNKLIKIFTCNKFSYENILNNKCNYLIMLGGSMFIEGKSKHLFSMFKNKKFYIIGSNFGPYYSLSFKNKYADLFSKACDVCFRDDYSYDLFKNNSKVRKASDIIFSLDIDKYLSNEKIVSISVVNPDIKLDKSYTKKYIRFINSIIKVFLEKKYRINLISFCKAEGDEDIINRLVSINDNTHISKICYNGDIDEILFALGKSEYVVGSRFHANIIGLKMNKKIIPIAYSDKTINALKDLGYNGKIYDIRALDTFDSNLHVYNEFQLDDSLCPLEHFKIIDNDLKEE